jgi:hypothetical protein
VPYGLLVVDLHLQEPGDVLPGYNQQMDRCYGSYVRKGHNGLVAVNDVPGNLTTCDIAK